MPHRHLLPTMREYERQQRNDAIAQLIVEGLGFLGCIGLVGMIMLAAHALTGAV